MMKPNIVKGSIYALAAFFFMAVFGILTKAALQGTSVYWVSFLAYLTGSLILLAIIAIRGFSYLKSDQYPCLIGRALFGTMASFLYTVSIQYIPIVNGTLLFNTAPIFIPILAVTFLKVKIPRLVWGAVALGFIGIIVIIKPTLAIFTEAGNTIALASGISLAIAYLLMKLLTATDPPVRIIFYYLGIGAIMQAPLLFFAGSLPAWEYFFLALASGIILLLAQLALVKGYQYAEASQVGIYQYASVVFVGLLSWWIWGEIPQASDLVGVVLVAIAGMMIIRTGNMANHR